MREWTYLVYVIFWCCLTLGGGYHIVFNLNRSGWWFLLAILLCSVICPARKWSALWDDKVRHQLHVEELQKQRE